MRLNIIIIFIINFFFGCNSGGQNINGEKKVERPNIVLILADDMGYSDLGSYGSEINTPNIDSLAYGGIRFTNFYNAGRCCPSRASLLTGIYPHQAGIGNMVYKDQGESYRGFLNSHTITLAEVLKEAGYKTMMSGKWHVGHKKELQWPTSRGFDRFYGMHSHVDSYWKVLDKGEVYLDGKLHIPATENLVNDLHPEKKWYTTDVFTDYGIHFLNEEVVADERKDSKPFFLYMAYNAPHFPLEAPDEDIAKYQGKYMEGWNKLREDKFDRMKKLGVISENSVLSPADNVQWDTLNMNDKKNLDFRRAIYSAQIDRLDQNVGRLVEHLKKIGEYENTLIIFLSDNGSSAETGMYGMNWNEHRVANYSEWKEEGGWSISQGQAWANVSNVPYRMYKKYVHEGGIATPLIIHWPDKIKRTGQINKRSGHVMDIMATLTDVAGTTYPKMYNGQEIINMEGKSLIPYLENEETNNHEYLYWEHIGNRAIRRNNWKLVAQSQQAWELYNLEEDPTELINLIDQKPELVKELKTEYFKWANRTGVREWPLNQKK